MKEMLEFMEKLRRAGAGRVDIWKIKEERTEVEGGEGFSWVQRSRKGYAVRWLDREGAVNFLFSEELRFDDSFFRRAQSQRGTLLLGGPSSAPEVSVYDPSFHLSSAYDRFQELPEEVSFYAETLRENFYCNSQGFEGHFRESLFEMEWHQNSHRFSAVSRRFEDLLRTSSIEGAQEKAEVAVLHPAASFQLLLNFLASPPAEEQLPENLTLLEDPTLPFGAGSFPFDASGFPAARRELVVEGRVLSLQPAFNLRPSIEEPPEKGWTNLLLQAPEVRPSTFVLIYELHFFPGLVLASSSCGQLKLKRDVLSFKGYLGRYRDGWFIGPPYIKSDFLVFDLKALQYS